jgi:hypothetical protein
MCGRHNERDRRAAAPVPIKVEKGNDLAALLPSNGESTRQFGKTEEAAGPAPIPEPPLRRRIIKPGLDHREVLLAKRAM